MSPRGSAIAQRLAFALEDLREHERQHPREVDALICTLEAHLTSWRRQSPVDDLPWPSREEMAEINRRNIEAAQRERGEPQ